MNAFCRSFKLAITFLLCVLNVTESTPTPKPKTGFRPVTDPSDIHGGVKMGVPSDFCDNAKDYITLDWDPASTDEYTCTEGQRKPGSKTYQPECTIDALKPVHKCYPTEIEYDDPLPTSGPHRPLWPAYGEYTYVPVQRWLHNLEHGGIVFLYHPCTASTEVAKLRAVATGCLKRHVISPYKKMPRGVNFVVLAWKCKLLLPTADVNAIVNFVKEHALRGPEAVSFDGQYTTGLITHAKTVKGSNKFDSNLCPDFSVIDAMAKKIEADSKSRRETAELIDGQVLRSVNDFVNSRANIS